MYSPEQIAAAVDLAALKPEHTKEATLFTCHEALEYRCASVCVKPCYVAVAANELEGTGVHVGTVINFPHGNSVPDVAALEAYMAIGEGATELDMVINIGAVLSGQWSPVFDGIAAVVNMGHEWGALVKVILETCYLPPKAIRLACRVCSELGVDYVKTSTGYGPCGATPGAVRVMRASCGKCEIKASGGITTYDDAELYLAMGCTRLGSSKIKELLP